MLSARTYQDTKTSSQAEPKIFNKTRNEHVIERTMNDEVEFSETSSMDCNDAKSVADDKIISKSDESYAVEINEDNSVYKNKEGVLADDNEISFVKQTEMHVLDSNADVDMNVVKTADGKYVEVQGTGEESTFSGDELVALLARADGGLEALFDTQVAILDGIE